MGYSIGVGTILADMADTVVACGRETFIKDVAFVTCSTYNSSLTPLPGITIFGCDILFNFLLLLLADWNKFVDYRTLY